MLKDIELAVLSNFFFFVSCFLNVTAARSIRPEHSKTRTTRKKHRQRRQKETRALKKRCGAWAVLRGGPSLSEVCPSYCLPRSGGARTAPVARRTSCATQRLGFVEQTVGKRRAAMYIPGPDVFEQPSNLLEVVDGHVVERERRRAARVCVRSSPRSASGFDVDVGTPTSRRRPRHHHGGDGAALRPPTHLPLCRRRRLLLQLHSN